MLKKFLATAATVLLALGLSVVAVAAPSSATTPYPPTDSAANNPDNWEVLPGEVCSKIDGTDANPLAVPYTLGAPPAGYEWSKIVVKAGSGDAANTIYTTGTGSAANTIYVQELVQGTPVQHATKNSISHIIFCSIPTGDDETDLECLPRSAVKYTYIPASNSGTITVTNPNAATYSNELCEGFWVTATSWKYTTANNHWPQVRDVVQKLPKITSVGTYPYVAAVACGQGDIYASFTAQPDPTEWLYGANNPFPENFLHNMGFSGPGQTWVQTSTNCTPSLTASASVSTTQPTCEQGGQLVLGTLVKATWVGEPVITATTYSVTAKADAGHLFSNGTDTLVLSGPLASQLTGGVCDDVSVAVTLTYVPECAVDSTNTWKVFNPSEETVVVSYGNGQTHSATPGYSTLNTPRSSTPFTITWGADASGVKPGSTTATPGSDLPGDDEECFTDPDVSKVVGACVYFQDGTAGNRTVTLTYDNEASALPVTFSLAGFQGLYDRTVPAGETVVVEAPNVLPAGGTYTVTAGDETFNILIDPCPSYDKPEPLVEQRPVASFDCDDTVVTVVTTTFTKEPIFNTETLEWGYGEWVEGESVTTTRAPLPEEITEAGCAVTVTDPVASTCDSEAPTELTSWIRITLNSNVEYRIDGAVVTTEYTSVTPGEHTVIAKALNGYTLESANPEPDYWTADTHTWTFTAADSSVECVPTLADVLPSFSYTPLTCTQAGSYTIGAEFGDVTWTVNGTVTPAGTYPVTTPGTIKLIASPTLETDTLNEAWDDEEIVLAFAYPDGACATPLALAMTGAATSAGVGWVGLLVVLTGLGLFFLRRKTTAQ